jgi:APA family basic amino acid/polyamine antiporter
MFLLLFVGVNVALIRLRLRHPELDRGYRVPFVPLTPILAILSMLFVAAIMLFQYPLAWLAAGAWILAGAGFYYSYSRSREEAFQAREAWMERIERKEYSVLVALSSPRSVPSLMEAGLAVAAHHQGRLVLVTVVEVPEGEALSTHRVLDPEVHQVLEAGIRYAEERGFHARSVVKIGRRISHGLVQTAREEECNFLIIGQPHKQSFLERVVSSIVERVLQNAPCQVGVLYGTLERDLVGEIVVPVTGGQNSVLAASLAPAFAEWCNASTEALTVIERGVPDTDARQFVDNARAVLREADFAGDLQVMRRGELANGLLRAIRRNQLVLIGAPSTGPVMPIIGETIPALIARRGHNPVLVVRTVAERRAYRFERWFFARRQAS